MWLECPEKASDKSSKRINKFQPFGRKNSIELSTSSKSSRTLEPVRA